MTFTKEEFEKRFNEAFSAHDGNFYLVMKKLALWGFLLGLRIAEDAAQSLTAKEAMKEQLVTEGYLLSDQQIAKRAYEVANSMLKQSGKKL